MSEALATAGPESTDGGEVKRAANGTPAASATASPIAKFHALPKGTRNWPLRQNSFNSLLLV